VVYQAWDRVERSTVALKVLRFNEADSLYRFKKGFRSLADLRHPNLVQFYELHSIDGLFFFSMELICGVDFLEALRGPAHQRRPPDFDTIRQATWQLARGLQTVHESGRLHRDIKPPNVLVLPRAAGEPWNGSEVKLLDFGLVAELELGRRSLPGVGQLIGTPAYMAPELANGDPGGPAGDWYGVGVMLYQALTGELPFGGSLVQILTRKQRGANRQELREAVEDLPADLEEICVRLLQPVPEQRLPGEELLELLEGWDLEGAAEAAVAREGAPATPDDGAGSSAIEALTSGLTASAQLDLASLTSGSSSASRRARRVLRRQEGSGPAAERATFVGRRDLIGALAEAYEDSRDQLAMVHLKGPSGIGKSALLRRFLSLVEERDESAVALYGRCYVQESVPYKALDSLIDALSRHLAALADDEVRDLLPAHLPALVRLFPVLSRVSEIASALRVVGPEDVAAPHALRQQAVAALRSLLSALGQRQTLVLAIDDLQWGDLDSLLLLEELFKAPELPRLLWIGAYRSEDEASSDFLQQLAAQRKMLAARGVRVKDLEVRRLEVADAEELVLTTLGGQVILGEREIAELLRDAAGSPLYLSELARFRAEMALPRAFGQGRQDEPAATAVRVRDLILLRVAPLSPAARCLLEVVAVAGKPIDLAVARQAAGLVAEGQAVLAELRTGRLIRVASAGGHDEIEAYHDRVREAVAYAMPADALRERNHQLALALEATGRADPETLAVLFQATAEEDRARRYVVEAARRAAETLAFERAARLYRLVLELLPATSDDRSGLQVQLAHALANSGRGHDAAETYLQAVGGSGLLDPLEMQRNAAEQLLISGHIDRGLAVLRHVLRTVDLQLSKESWHSLLALWLLRWRLRWRGFGFVERPEADVDPKLLRRIDVCWAVEIGLCQVDVLRSAEFHARHLLLALQAGEPQRIARGLAMEVFFGAMEGLDPAATLEKARSIAGKVEGHYAASLTEMAAGMVACSRGEWRRAHRRLSRAEDQLRENRQGMVWERDTVYQFHSIALLNLGRWPELFERFPKLMAHARSQGDLYLEVHLRHWVESLRLLAEDQPEAAQEVLDGGQSGWSSQGFHLQHFGRLIAQTRVALYLNDGQMAWDLVELSWPELERSMIQRIEMVHVQSLDLRARCALAAAGQSRGPARLRLLKVAAEAADKLAGIRSSWAQALRFSVSAGIALLQGHPAAARQALLDAEPNYAASEMTIHAATVRYRLGCLVGRGQDMAAAELVDLGIAKPSSMANILLPGPWAGA
jgi:serine/threonine protein kinase